MKKSNYLVISLLFIFSIQNVLAGKAILAGGCFWCMESDFEKLDGVTSVVSGFTGGKIPDPTYLGDHKGHYEAVEITYDNDVINYQDILKHFWVNVDPFDAKGQFCDKGSSYLSAVFVSTEEERFLAEQSKQKVIEMFPTETVVTPIFDASVFYPIKGSESHHQDFYKNNPIRYNAYRWHCGRDKRLKTIWGNLVTIP